MEVKVLFLATVSPWPGVLTGGAGSRHRGAHVVAPFASPFLVAGAPPTAYPRQASVPLSSRAANQFRDVGCNG